MQILLENGASVEILDTKKKSALYYAYKKKRNSHHVVDLLLLHCKSRVDFTAKIDAKNNFPLIYVIKNNLWQVAKVMIKHQLEINVQDKVDLNTPLSLMLLKQQWE